jgi:uncharacterized beta-barrel protein YwiB (DUF1934 family)
MTKDVLLSISGLHYEIDGVAEQEEQEEPIEVITPASYYLKNGKHYVIYDEVVEGMPGVIKNKIRITEGEKLEIIKDGMANSHMVFEKDKINMTDYRTPYGEILIGTHTNRLDVDVAEDKIEVHVAYAMDINSEKVADCTISINIKALER